MKVFNLFNNITSPYSTLEAWGYDYFIASAVYEFMDDFEWKKLGIWDVPSDGLVVDIGCGGGHLLKKIAESRNDVTLMGFDLSYPQLMRSKQRLEKFSEKLNFINGSVLSLPFDKQSFDGLVSIGSIKHWPDPFLGLKECIRVVKKGGYLLIIEVDRGCYLKDADAFVKRFKFPLIVQPFLLPVFRTWIAGQSLDLDDARKLGKESMLSSFSVSRMHNIPALMIEGVV
ncbi:MAG: class I SAM-dependent methyltransferase [Desulfobacterales bacterium]|nr:class I SAM-dependent methyltransferase [Desulfobacterales bacterium]